ncbi:MAG TPA: glycosyl hydrolase family 18 protein [Actinomycetota bacterium]|nr:glycosyl hydrolase family 18 protein [Actinomycetota bacterium]
MIRATRLSAAVALVLSLQPPPASAAPGIVLGWTTASTSSARTLASSAPGLNTLSPTWWHLKSDGTVSGTGDRALSDWAHSRGMKVWPLFGNGTNPDASHRAITDEGIRGRMIARVGELATAAGADGVNIDWENLHTADRDAFAAFVREASAAWRSRGLTVSVDVTPLSDTWEMGNWTAAYDRAALGEAVDYVVLMAYDQHNRLKPNGPTAALPWVEDSVRYLLRSVPAPKVILGVPFYSRDWTDSAPPEVVFMKNAPERLRSRGATSTWDAQLGLTYATYVRNGAEHRIWVEDERSLALKAALVDKYSLAGLAAWRLGFETPSAWRAVTGAAPPSRPAAQVARTPAPTPVPSPSPSPPTPLPLPPLPTLGPVTRAAGPAPKEQADRTAVTALAAVSLLLGLGAVGHSARRQRRSRRRG